MTMLEAGGRVCQGGQRGDVIIKDHDKDEAVLMDVNRVKGKEKGSKWKGKDKGSKGKGKQKGRGHGRHSRYDHKEKVKQ